MSSSQPSSPSSLPSISPVSLSSVSPASSSSGSLVTAPGAVIVDLLFFGQTPELLDVLRFEATVMDELHFTLPPDELHFP